MNHTMYVTGISKDVDAFWFLAHNPHKQRHVPPLEKIAGCIQAFLVCLFIEQYSVVLSATTNK